MNKAYDYKLLHDAVMCLLDVTYGEERIRIARERIREGKQRASLAGKSFPVNYIISLAQEYPFEMLQLLDMAERKLPKLKAMCGELTPDTTKRKAVAARNADLYRERVRCVYALEAIKVGHKLSKNEQKDVLTHYQRIWKRRYDEYRVMNPGVKYQQVMSTVSAMINKELADKLASAQKNPEFYFGMKSRSTK